MSQRITKKKLESLVRGIGERDFHILRALQQYRYLTTHHLRRLYFTDSASHQAALRAACRILTKLHDHGLIEHLNRRIGGVRAGSGAFVWTLTPAGVKLLALSSRGEGPQTRLHHHEPSQAFMEHTLAVAETFVRLREMELSGKISLTTITNEPGCWRHYAGLGGSPKILKPDLFSVTASGEYEDNWFLEIDLATEAPITVLRKCQQYTAYYKTGAEQHLHSVFPYVVWIVPDSKRRETMTRRIIKDLPPSESDLFIVILMDELETLIVNGAETFNKERTTP